MNWNTKYVILVMILISSLISITLNGLVTIIILVSGGFVFWFLQVAKKHQITVVEPQK
jgi:hypothetical protein